MKPLIVKNQDPINQKQQSKIINMWCLGLLLLLGIQGSQQVV